MLLRTLDLHDYWIALFFAQFAGCWLKSVKAYNHTKFCVNVKKSRNKGKKDKP